MRSTKFWLERFVPIFLIWLGVAAISPAVLWLLGAAFHFTAPKINLSAFGDWRLLVVLCLGVGAVYLALWIPLQLGLSFTSADTARKNALFQNMWNEVSGAALHVSCALLAAWPFTNFDLNSFPWPAIVLILLAGFIEQVGRANVGAR